MKLIFGKTALVVATSAFLAGFAYSGSTVAGDFHRLVEPVANGGGLECTWSTPQNTGSAMEMAAYEFTTPAADSYRCRITSNSTGQDLTLRLIGLTGSPIVSVTTPVNGTGLTSYVSLGGGYTFQCTVASGAGSPVSGGNYRVCVQRQ